jgi:hypothetical protein
MEANYKKSSKATQNCGHPTLMVLNSDWSSLGCFFSIIAIMYLKDIFLLENKSTKICKRV